ncbi:MAG TPA: hypothetical protein VIY96_04005 [Thermoanaerobaculia bacterium]
MTRRAAGAAAIMFLLCAAACSRRAHAPGPLPPPTGDAVWFADGIGADDSTIEETLLRAGISAVYLSARHLTPEGSSSPEPAPPIRPLARIPVVLVVEASTDPLVGADDKRAKEFGGVLAREVSAAARREPAFGSVRGVLLDVPFSGETADAHATALREARSRLSHLLARADAGGERSRAISITISMRDRPPADEKQRKAVRALASRSDGIVAFVFGDDNAADVAFVDSLGKPWWAAYASATHGAVQRPSDPTRVPVPESALDALTDDPRTELLHELPWNEGRGSEFTLRATRSIRIPGVTLAAGDSVVFTEPSLPDLVARFRADTSGRSLARGRILVVGGGGETGRIFPVAALGDVIAGRRAAPELRGWIQPDGPRLVRIGAQNPTPHASLVSRIQNWIEVDLAPARVGDVETGGFERWEAYDERGRLVSPGRATRIRLYETLVAPFEQLEPARVRVRGALPAGCCAFRTHLAPAAGGEVVTEWGRAAEVGAAAKTSP